MDLNRCFLLKDLEKDYSVDDPALSWEELRAQQLNSMMGPKGSANPKVDFIIDLHNTTSNSGASTYIPMPTFNFWSAALIAGRDSALCLIFIFAR